MDMIQRLARNVDERLSESGVDEEVKAWALGELEEVSLDLDRVLSGDSRRRFVTSYLTQERHRAQADSTDDLPEWVDADETRDDPLCYCGNDDCDVKLGRIPVGVDDIREYVQSHAGYPAALVEANEAYLEARAEVHQTLRRIYASLGSNRILEDLADDEAEISAES